jgi:hypothetical protein
LPNLSFYAAGRDFGLILEHVFARSGCRVFESYSQPGAKLREFHSAEEVVSAAASTPEMPFQLQLVTASSSGLYRIDEVKLEAQEHGGEALRHAIRGHGLIHIYLGILRRGQLEWSHTTHNPASGAGRWESKEEELSALAPWNWKEITAVSRGLIRIIRKLAVFELDDRPVLPAAVELFKAGKKPKNPADAAAVSRSLGKR